MTPTLGHPKPSLAKRVGRMFGFGRPVRRQSPMTVQNSKLVYGALGPQVVAFSPPSVGYSSSDAATELHGSRSVKASGDAHLRVALEDMVSESQQLSRNNTIYRALLRRLVDLVVGSGWCPQARTRSNGLNTRIEAAYALRSRQMEMRGLDDAIEFQRKACWHALVDGRVGFIKDEPSGRLQAISGDRIHSYAPYAEHAKGSARRIEHGVELDSLGRPTRFHIADWEEWGQSLREGKPIDARHMIYWANRDRFDETAGAPPLQAVFSHLHRLNDVFDSEAAAWQILSRMAIKITKKDAAASIFPKTGPDPPTTPPSLSDRVSEMPWGLAFMAEPGEDIAGIERNLPSANFDASVKAFLRICGMEIGLSLPFFLLDWSEVNFASGRAGARQLWRNAQKWFNGLEYVLSEDYKWWIAREVAAGTFPERADIAAHEWVPDPFEPLDKDKENKADQTAVKSSFTTVTRVLRERGVDRDEHNAERASELAAAAAAVKVHNSAYPDQPVTISQFLGEQADAQIKDVEPEVATP